MDLFTVVIAILVLLALWMLIRRPSRCPPGPPLWPVVGNMFYMDADPRVTSRKLRERYGDVSCVYMFNKPFIFLQGYDVIKDALVKHADVFSDRPHTSVFAQMSGHDRGVVSSSGSVWKEQRKFSLTTLRDLGMGKPVIEDKIQEEIVVFLQAIEDEKRQPFDPTILLLNAASNVICSVVFGRRFEYNNPTFQNHLTSVDKILKAATNTGIANVFPSLKYLPGDFFKQKFLRKTYDFLKRNLIEPNIAEHMKKRDDFKDDFISDYIEEMERRQKKESNTSMHGENLSTVIMELFMGGTDTTSTTLKWIIAYLVNYPEVQEKCFQDIKENIGLNRPPTMKDKTNLPYIEAVIAETQRLADIAPTGGPHAVSQDVEFRGYLIPKGAIVIPMINSVLHDPKVWGDPENYRPERFLDSNGRYQKKEEAIPFSIGRRVCLGEALARMELILFLVALIQKFEFVAPHGVKPSLEGTLGAVYSPRPFKVIAKVRE